MRKDLSILEGIYISHRGLHNNEIPENSLMAFKNAIEKCLAIELDLHLLKDNEVVVFHDDNLKRMTGLDKDIKDCTYEEIKNLKLLDSNEHIPLLKEVFDLVDGKVILDIEFKYDNKVGLLEKETCKLLDNYNGTFLVKSFDPFSVLWFKRNRPNYIRGQLSSDFSKDKFNIIKKIILKKMLFNFFTKPDFIAYDIKAITTKQIKSIKKKNISLLFWTISNNEELEFAKKHDCSIIYENIEIKMD